MSKRDLIAIGRSSIDLYSQDIGVPFKEISGFNAFVGGSPLNISVGCSRLGLKSTLLTAIGKDKVGEFILNFLNKENVSTEFIPIKENARSSAVLFLQQQRQFFQRKHREMLEAIRIGNVIYDGKT